MKIQLALMLVLAVLAGALGWYVARKRRRSIYDEKPIGMSDAAFQQRGQRRHAMRRLAVATLYAAVGAVLGGLLGMMPMFR
jgi:hypothetical protein